MASNRSRIRFKRLWGDLLRRHPSGWYFKRVRQGLKQVRFLPILYPILSGYRTLEYFAVTVAVTTVREALQIPTATYYLGSPCIGDPSSCSKPLKSYCNFFVAVLLQCLAVTVKSGCFCCSE